MRFPVEPKRRPRSILLPQLVGGDGQPEQAAVWLPKDRRRGKEGALRQATSNARRMAYLLALRAAHGTANCAAKPQAAVIAMRQIVPALRDEPYIR